MAPTCLHVNSGRSTAPNLPIMQAEDKRTMRAVVRRVHPDLFAAHPYERAKNTESLKVRADGHVNGPGFVFGSLGLQCFKSSSALNCIYIVCKGWLRICSNKYICTIQCIYTRCVSA